MLEIFFYTDKHFGLSYILIPLGNKYLV